MDRATTQVMNMATAAAMPYQTMQTRTFFRVVVAHVPTVLIVVTRDV